MFIFKVYLATRKHTGKKYAIKAFSKEDIAEQEEGAKGLFLEIMTMRAIGRTSRYCQKFYEIHETVHSVYIVVEYLSGGELLDKLSSSKRIKQKYVRNILRNVLLGLAHMHSKGVMHRDLKPENLMLKGKKISDVRIIDFGLSTFIDAEEYLYKRCGTPGFVAPEVIKHGEE